MSTDEKSYALALHTSSPELGLAINHLSGNSRSQTWNLGRELSSQLHLHLSQFIQPQTWSDFAYLAVARGPGSFTGTRMGVVTARTLAQQLNIPLFAISTLAAAAWHQINCNPQLQQKQVIALQLPAQRGQLFVAIYQLHPQPHPSLTPLLSDTVMSADHWQQTLKDWQTPYQLLSLEGGLGKAASSLLGIAHLFFQKGQRPHWSEAIPFYGQHPVH